MRLILGGTASGAGKTSVCLALAAGLGKKGVQFRGFKAGPDYLDPKYMEIITGRTCYNLDPWMSSEEHVRELIAASAGIALIEGVMGYYDGADVSDSSGSTAHLAEILNSPVILVANARAMARSFGALIKGFVEFEKAGLRIKGVIANNCGSSRHIDMLSRVLESTGLPPLAGGIPSRGLPELGSRHLGLKVPDKEELNSSVYDSFALAAENYLDLDMIITLAGEEKEQQQVQVQGPARPGRVRIAVARDKAFNFYYQANLDILEKAGAELVYFSPVTDKRIPEEAGMLYLGGGYPELYAYELSQNRALRRDILNYIQSGGHVYAECGGLIYLCRDLKVSGGQVFPMTGALPFKASMLSRRKSLGYVQISFLEDCLLGDKDQTIRGHEYHYSQIDQVEKEEGWKNIYQVVNHRREPRDTLGIKTGNILAGYAHVYFGHRPEVAERIVQWIEG
ncbi:MAG: cobyrinate a,c-diamide synthase [Desulfonatronovibrio sp.]